MVELSTLGATIKDAYDDEASAFTDAQFLKLADYPPTAKEYGAIGDGVAADQAALTSLGSSGADTVRIPSGTYLLNSNATFANDQWVNIENGATFTGAGALSNAGLTDVSLMGKARCTETIAITGATSQYGKFISMKRTGTPSAASESDALIVIAESHLDATTYNADVVGIGARAYIPSTNTNGRAWGLNAYGKITSSGDGLLIGIEVNIENNGSDVTTPNVAKAKYGINITTKSSTKGTAAINIGNASNWHYGLYAEQSSFNSSASFFIDLKDYFSVTAAGEVEAVDLTLNRGAGSATPGSSLFQEYQQGGSTLFGQRLGASNSYWHFDRYYSSAWSRVLTVQRSTGNFGIGVDPTEALDIGGDAIRLRTAQTPASASATGSAGMICWDASYIYVCTATDTWKRSAIATW